MEEEILKSILVNMPNFIGFGLLSIVLYRQNNKLIDLLGGELKFWRERANVMSTVLKQVNDAVPSGAEVR